MGRRLTLASHLSTEELEQRYKSALVVQKTPETLMNKGFLPRQQI